MNAWSTREMMVRRRFSFSFEKPSAEKTNSESSNQHLIWKKVEVVLRIIYPEKANIGETNGSQA